ncbi:hypothetical protein E4U24_000137 [Claviceps purpurea]|nr:hypothetical protein E4U24_000137 [Claviceps purpurea]
MDLQVPQVTLEHNVQPCHLQNSSSLDYGHPRGIVLSQPVVPRSGTRHCRLRAGIYHRASSSRKAQLPRAASPREYSPRPSRRRGDTEEDIWSPWEAVKHPWIAQEPTTQASESPFPAIVHYTCPSMKLLHLLLPPLPHGYLSLRLFLPVVFGADADYQQQPHPLHQTPAHDEPPAPSSPSSRHHLSCISSSQQHACPSTQHHDPACGSYSRVEHRTSYTESRSTGRT